MLSHGSTLASISISKLISKLDIYWLTKKGHFILKHFLSNFCVFVYPKNNSCFSVYYISNLKIVIV